jgi:Transmembrane protein 131-like N-terminal
VTSWLAKAVCVLFLVGHQAAYVAPNSSAPPAVTITPSGLDFGAQSVGSSTSPKTATLTNSGKAPVTILDITASGIDFSEKDQCQGTLAPQAGCTLSVTFKPAITGPRMGTVVVTTSEAPHTLFLLLTGSGV